MPGKGYSVTVVSAKVGEVIATAAYPDDQNNYWLALTGTDGRYDVYKVLQEFTAWDAPQPITFGDGVVPLGPGTYTLALRERVPWQHSFHWKTHESVEVTL